MVIVSVVEVTPRPNPTSLVLATDVVVLLNAEIEATVKILTGDVVGFFRCPDVVAFPASVVVGEVSNDVDVDLTSLTRGVVRDDARNVVTASPTCHVHKPNLKVAQIMSNFHDLIPSPYITCLHRRYY